MMQGPTLSTPVTKKCSNIGRDCVVFLKRDFYDLRENYFPMNGPGRGIYRVDIALRLIGAGSLKELSIYFFLSELFLINFWIGVILVYSDGS